MKQPIARGYQTTVSTVLAGALLLAGCSSTPDASAVATSMPTAPTATSANSSAPTATPTTPTAVPTTATERVASTAGVATAALATVRFTNGARTAVLPIEVPPTSEYGIGLSGRRTLSGRGMLFAFPDSTTTAFWMKNTHIDLDIAFVDGAMRIIHVDTMRADTEDLHHPAAPYVAVVEAPAGWYAEHGVTPGAQVVLDIDLRAVPAQ